MYLPLFMFKVMIYTWPWKCASLNYLLNCIFGWDLTLSNFHNIYHFIIDHVDWTTNIFPRTPPPSPRYQITRPWGHGVWYMLRIHVADPDRNANTADLTSVASAIELHQKRGPIAEATLGQYLSGNPRLSLSGSNANHAPPWIYVTDPGFIPARTDD